MSKKILIVEDEPLIADDIAMILDKKGYSISDIVDNAEDALNTVAKNEVDIVLLDINIEGENDGIYVAHELNKNHGTPFIFLTSYYDNNTLKRVKNTDPAGYIVKPFVPEDLVANIELALLRSSPKQEEIPPEKFFVRGFQGLTAIDPVEILYAESDDNYANIHTAKKKHVVSHTLKSVEEQLKDLGFIRVHKSYLVNFRKVTNIHEGYLFIENIKIPIGRTYKEELLNNLTIL